MTPKPDAAIDATDEMWESIPDHLKEGLARYLDQGIIPGSFLAACLCDDLHAAVSRAGRDLTMQDLRSIMEFLYNGCPVHSWGSYEAIRVYSERRMAPRFAAEFDRLQGGKA